MNAEYDASAVSIVSSSVSGVHQQEAFVDGSSRKLISLKKPHKHKKRGLEGHSKDGGFSREKDAIKRPLRTTITPGANSSPRYEDNSCIIPKINVNDPFGKINVRESSSSSCSIPIEFHSRIFMIDESYINIFINSCGHLNTSEDESYSDSQDRLSPIVSGIYKVLIDVMEFQVRSVENIFDIVPMAEYIDSVQTVSSVNDFIMLQITSKTLNSLASCHTMEEISLAFRLAAHSILKATTNHTQKDRRDMIDKNSMNILLEAQKRGLVTLLKSLRRLFGSILDFSCELEELDPLKENITGFFGVDREWCYFSKAQILLLDIVPLLTDGNENVRAVKGKTFQFVIENLLKLDSISIGRKMKAKGLDIPWDFNDGLIEMFVRQILRKESDGSVRKMLEKISKNQPNSVAHCCIMDHHSSKCSRTILEVIKFRKFQLQRLERMSNQSIDESMNQMTFDGCSLIADIVRKLRSSSFSCKIGHRLAYFLEELRQSDGLIHMTFYLFHTIMQNGIVVTTQSNRKERLIAAALASFLLSSKSFDCPFPVKNMIKIIVDTQADECYDISFATDLEIQIQLYEFQLLSSLGFVLPSYRALPYSFIDDVIVALELNPSFTFILRDILLDECFTHSKLFMLNDSKLVAYAAYHYACRKGLSILSPHWESKLCKRDKCAINLISAYIKQESLCLQNKKRCIDAIAPLETPSIMNVLCSINGDLKVT